MGDLHIFTNTALFIREISVDEILFREIRHAERQLTFALANSLIFHIS